MTITEALVQIISQANQANNKITYDYLLSEAESIMNQIRDEQVKYCDFAVMLTERLELKSRRLH